MCSKRITLLLQSNRLMLFLLFALQVGALAVMLALVLPVGDLNASSSDYTLTKITTLVTDGSRPQWSANGNWIAYDHKEADGYYDVYLIHPDGKGNVCLTCDRTEVPKNNGSPNYHPSGRYLVFTAEKVQHASVPTSTTVWIEPGTGMFHDVAVLDFLTGSIYRLTDVRSGLAGPPVGGSLHPRFSHKDTRLMWSDFQDSGSDQARYGNWQIAVADFITTPQPHLENVTFYNPGAKPEWLETQGWTLDDSGIYVACAPLEGQDDYFSDFGLIDLATQQLTRLTLTSGLNGEPFLYEEHGAESSLGDAIAFMSSDRWSRADLWIMNLDLSLIHISEPTRPY